MNISLQENRTVFQLVKCVIFIFGIIALYNLVGIFVVNDNAATRLTFHDFYCQKENVDVVVIGSSRVNEGFNPYIADERTNINTFNLGTASQTLDASYYVIKESINRYNVNTIFLSVEFEILTRDIGGQKNTWIVSDYMTGVNKYEYVSDVCKPSDWPLMLSRVYRYKDDISLKNCLNNFKAKFNLAYWNYENQNKYYTNYSYYVGKGLIYREKVNEGYDFFAYKDSYGEFDEVNLEQNNDEMIEYLIRAINLCKSKNVNLILFTMPESKFYIAQSGKYNLFTQFMNNISEEYNVPYYDFNLLADDVFTDLEFANLDHLTFEGANHFSKILSDIYEDPNSHTFYSNIEDNLRGGVTGITYCVDEVDAGYRYQWNVMDTMEDAYKYKIYGYSADMNLIYESNVLDNTVIVLESNPEIIVIDLIDGDGEYIGNAKFL